MIIRYFVCLVLLGSTGFVFAEPQDQRDELLVEAGEVKVTVEDFERYVQERIASGISPEVFAQGRTVRQSLENIMSIRLLAQKARSRGIELSEQHQWEIDLYEDRLLFKQLVASDVAQAMDRDWEQAAREKYIANPDQFAREERVRVSHILLGTDERTESEALELAQDLAQRLEAGEKLSKLALKYSDDPSVEENKGDLGYFVFGEMAKPFSETAFALNEPGDVSEPVKTRFGYHVIQLHGRQSQSRKSFEEAKGGIIEDLQRKVEPRIRDRYTTDARSSSYDVDEDLLNALIAERQKMSE